MKNAASIVGLMALQVVASFTLASCSDEVCPVGAQGCLCRSDDSCDEGLSCNSVQVCVDPDDDDPEASNGTGGHGKAGTDSDASTATSTTTTTTTPLPEPACSADLEREIIEFCEQVGNAATDPAPGQSGSDCSSGDQCNGVCLDDWPYDGSGYCADRCSTDADCPFGFECDLNGDDRVCVDRECFVGPSAASCISEYLERADDACDYECGDRFETWFRCLAESGPVCFEFDAPCDAERGLLDHCCEQGAFCG